MDTAFPSDKFDCAVRVTAVPPPSSGVEAAARQCRGLVAPLLQEEVSDDELARVKLQAQVCSLSESFFGVTMPLQDRFLARKLVWKGAPRIQALGNSSCNEDAGCDSGCGIQPHSCLLYTSPSPRD